MPRHFLKDSDLNSVEQAEVLALAQNLKSDPHARKVFEGPRTVAVIFDKPSTRTRVSFAVGITDLGGSPLIIDSQSSQLGVKESVADTARVLERQVAQIIWRTFSQSGLLEMSQYSKVPVINALSDQFHPCQVLADLLTIMEHKGSLSGIKLVFVGDGNNMAHSYLLAGATAGMHVVFSGPKGYFPDSSVLDEARNIAERTGGSISIITDPQAALVGADVVATDTWVSMGQEAAKQQRLTDFAGYTITQELMTKAKPDAIVLHCLPAYRGYEISAEVLDGPQSVIWDQAENRLHAQKALMVWLDEHAK